MNIKQIKEQLTCFDILGQPVKRSGNSWLYHAPWRTDKHPSLAVSENGKGWKDWATGEHGNVVDLIGKIIGSTDLSAICQAAASFSFSQSNSYHFDRGKKKEKPTATANAYTIHPLQSYPLQQYVEARGIPIGIARKYLSELHWMHNGQTLYTLAYHTDQGGWVTRNLRFKRVFGFGGITTHLTKKNAPWVIFEGFFDLLSWVVLCGGVAKHNFISLNSVANIDVAIRQLAEVSTRVYLALDNDSAGDQATAKMLTALPNATDIRIKFKPHNDINDYLIDRGFAGLV